MPIDTHSHLCSDNLYGDLEGVVLRAENNDVKKIVTIGCEKGSYDKTYLVGQKYENIFTSYGLCPHKVEDWNEELRDEIIQYLKKDHKVRAYGEIGLEYYYLDKNKDIDEQKKLQREVFQSQLEIACEFSLPTIVHSREAEEDTVKILEKFIGNKVVIHCFTGSKLFAQKIIAMGFNISFTGIVTFDKTGTLMDIIKSLPINRIMIETDSPYLAPVPKRGTVNEPSNLKYTFEYIANNLKMSEEDLDIILMENSKAFFNI